MELPIYVVESIVSQQIGPRASTSSSKLFLARMLDIALIFNANFYFRCEVQARLY